MRLVIVKASTPGEIEEAFAFLAAELIGPLIVGDDPLFFVQPDQLAVLAARGNVPAINYLRDFADAGGLMSYGPSITDAHRLAGTYVGRIFKGEKPADLPVQQSTRVELVINLKTARALGLKVPLPLLARANEVIE